MARFLFVHLAKTGGLSVRRMLMASRGMDSFDCLHHGVVLKFRDGKLKNRTRFEARHWQPYDLAFLMARHPMARLLSCYSYFLQGGLNQIHPGRSCNDRQWQEFLQEQIPSFRLCCERLPEVAARIPHIRPMSDWLEALPDPPATEVLMGRTETFVQDVRQLFERLGLALPGASLLHVNRSSPSLCQPPIDLDMYQRVHHFYRHDYGRFAYDPYRV